jgi:hypothetical protein
MLGFSKVLISLSFCVLDAIARRMPSAFSITASPKAYSCCCQFRYEQNAQVTVRLLMWMHEGHCLAADLHLIKPFAQHGYCAFAQLRVAAAAILACLTPHLLWFAFMSDHGKWLSFVCLALHILRAADECG